MSDQPTGTGIFAPIYVCSEHGHVDGVEMEDIDTENDKIYPFVACSKCFRHVEPLMENGLPVMREVSAEELFWESQCEEE